MKREHHEIISTCTMAMEEDLLDADERGGLSGQNIPESIELLAITLSDLIDDYMETGVSYKLRRKAARLVNHAAMVIKSCNRELLSRLN